MWLEQLVLQALPVSQVLLDVKEQQEYAAYQVLLIKIITIVIITATMVIKQQ